MAKNKLTLDALIKREDFDVEIDSNFQIDNKATVSIQELEKNGFFYSALRKPDFQRETNEWDSEKAIQFIESFINGDLIPSIILWKNTSGIIFVIDGSHRISALIAWINDDYGDGRQSADFFKGSISEEQKKVAEEMREKINGKIGAYNEYKPENIDLVSPEMKAKIYKLGSLAIQIQWVRGNSDTAEKSFFKINEKATPIDNTEKKLIKSRRKPTGIASRAVMRAGTGHKYWSNYKMDIQKKIEELSKEIHNLLFKPEYESTIKNLDLPIAGKALTNQGLALVYNTVKICNKLGLNDDDGLSDDETGEMSISFLKNTQKYLKRITGNSPGSLGLHPAIYFFSRRGVHKVASYYGILEFIVYLEEKKLFKEFTFIRKKFEEYLVNNDNVIQQIVRKYRQSTNSYKNLKEYYMKILEILLNNEGITQEELKERIKKDEEFNYLKFDDINFEEGEKSQFTRESKNVIFFNESIKNLSRCPICNGYLSHKSATVDHIIRVEDGGKGKIQNGQFTHPFCNSSIKN